VNAQLRAKPTWSIKSNQEKVWRQAAVTINENQDFQVVFEATIFQSGYGGLALDDILIDQNEPCNQPTASCSFEQNGICQWSFYVDEDNALNYIYVNAEELTSAYQVSPIKVDATTNTQYGRFLWTSSNYGNFFGSKAALESILFSDAVNSNDYPNGACFSLKYIINGTAPTTSGFNILLYSTEFTNIQFVAFIRQEVGDQNNSGALEWKRHLVPLDQVNGYYEIYVQSVINGDDVTAMALDDLLLFDKTCAQVEAEEAAAATKFKCADGKTLIERDSVCNFINDCAQGEDEQPCGNCNFENSTCLYEASNSSALVWKRVQAKQSINGPTSKVLVVYLS
jgi:hypothetical protein